MLRTTVEKQEVDFTEIKRRIQKSLSEKTLSNIKPFSAGPAALVEIKKKPAKQVKRVKFGIPGFDNLISEGVPDNAIVLVAGASGSGKSIFCLQSLIFGALNGEPGVYISFEEEPESIRQAERNFGWDIDKLEKNKMLSIIFKDPYEVENFAKTLAGELHYTLQELNAKRVVIDSVTYFALTLRDKYLVRKELDALAKRFKKLDILTFMISEIPRESSSKKLSSQYGMEEFLADAVIHLHDFTVKRVIRQRAIEILKMRLTQHDRVLRPFVISRTGIQVYPRAQVFNE
ncbi:MAG: RAD55 family ATPase [Candidatus Micrarchaeia archaeon]